MVHDKWLTIRVWIKVRVRIRVKVRVRARVRVSGSICREPFVANRLSLNVLSVNVLSWIPYKVVEPFSSER